MVGHVCAMISVRCYLWVEASLDVLECNLWDRKETTALFFDCHVQVPFLTLLLPLLSASRFVENITHTFFLDFLLLISPSVLLYLVFYIVILTKPIAAFKHFNT